MQLLGANIGASGVALPCLSLTGVHQVRAAHTRSIATPCCGMAGVRTLTGCCNHREGEVDGANFRRAGAWSGGGKAPAADSAARYVTTTKAALSRGSRSLGELAAGDLSRFRLYGLDRLTVIQLDVGAHFEGFELGQRQSEHGESLAAEETIWIRQRFSSSSSFCSCSVAAAGMAADAGSKLSQRSFGSRSGSRDDVFGS